MSGHRFGYICNLLPQSGDPPTGGSEGIQPLILGVAKTLLVGGALAAPPPLGKTTESNCQ